MSTIETFLLVSGLALGALFGYIIGKIHGAKEEWKRGAWVQLYRDICSGPDAKWRGKK